MISESVDELAQILWGYLVLHQAVKSADILLVLGSHDLRIPKYAATLFHNGLAPLVIVSGGIAHTDDLLKTSWQGTEADEFARVMTEEGIPSKLILKEDQAKNLGDNFVLTRRLLEEKGIAFQSALVVTKPFVERRAYAAGVHWWPDKHITITSPPLSFQEYTSSHIKKDDVINLLVGNVQRLELYASKGWQIPQEVPSFVHEAYEKLKSLGYAQHLFKEKS